jgi:hypothetical protein
MHTEVNGDTARRGERAMSLWGPNQANISDLVQVTSLLSYHILCIYGRKLALRISFAQVRLKMFG